jgi:hypothetical protein
MLLLVSCVDPRHEDRLFKEDPTPHFEEDPRREDPLFRKIFASNASYKILFGY